MMSFLQTINGKRGEELTSACLAYLLNNSKEVQASFMGLLSKVDGIGPVSFEFLEASLEVTATEVTDQGTNNRRRVDLLIETDNYVFGIENKLWAEFQVDQPSCYSTHAKARAKALEATHGGEVKSAIIVIAPDSRRSQVKERLRDQCLPEYFISWWQVLDALQQCSISALPIKVFADELILFLQFEHTVIPDKDLPSLREPLAGKAGNAAQARLIGRVWEFFRPAELYEKFSGFTTGAEHRWYGTKFLQGSQEIAWYGFTNKTDQRAAMFVVAIKKRLAADMQFDSQIANELSEGSSPGWVFDQWRVLEVNLDAYFKKPEQWVHLLEPVHRAVAGWPLLERQLVGRKAVDLEVETTAPSGLS